MNDLDFFGEFMIEDDVIVGYSGSDSYAYVPYGIVGVGDSAFLFSDSLATVFISDGVEYIGNNAFSSCGLLTDITIPDSVTSIGESAFSNCESLVNITLPESITELGDGAFEYCTALTELVIPKNVKYFGDRLCDSCTSLAKVVIQNGVTAIGEEAFYGCESLTEITLPESLTEIGDGAFSSCPSVQKIYVPFDKLSLLADQENEIKLAAIIGCMTAPESKKLPDNKKLSLARLVKKYLNDLIPMLADDAPAIRSATDGSLISIETALILLEKSTSAECRAILLNYAEQNREKETDTSGMIDSKFKLK